MCLVQSPCPLLAPAPKENVQVVEVSSLLQLPIISLKSQEPKKPKRQLSAFNLFYRDERQRLLDSLHEFGVQPKKGHGKIGFADLTRFVAANWKSAPVEERLYYHLLAQDDKQRYEEEMNQWQLAVKQHKIETGPVDLPSSLNNFFDDVPVDVEQPTPMHHSPSIPLKNSSKSRRRRRVVRPVSDIPEDTFFHEGQDTMEKVYGDMPSLLGDIGDDAPWPF